MNQRKCKRLRRLARVINVGVESHATVYTEKLHRKVIKIGDKEFPYMVEQRVLMPYCTRDIYKRLKRGSIDIGL